MTTEHETGDGTTSEQAIDNPADAGAITRLSARYAEAFPLRSAIQAIPVLGGSLDTMLAGLGQRWQYERLQAFISALDQRLRTTKGYETLPEVQPSEPLYDFIMKVFDHVIRTRSQQKQDAFAAIAARQAVQPHPWDEADAAARLLADLSDLHVEILKVATTAPVCGSFDGLRIITLSPAPLDGAGTRLSEVLSGTQERALRLACSELVARGLLHDEGIGRWDVGAMDYLVATDIASWFLNWLGLRRDTEEGA